MKKKLYLKYCKKKPKEEKNRIDLVMRVGLKLLRLTARINCYIICWKRLILEEEKQ